MTDNEIIKALECCSDEMGCKKGCPCFDPKSKSSHCTAVGDNGLEKLALDLINRQKAEIERLNEYISRCKSGEEYWVKCLLERPNEAIKEFAKYLLDNYASGGVISAVDVVDAVVDWGTSSAGR